MQSQEYNGHISGKIAKRHKHMDVQMKSLLFTSSSYPIFIVYVLHNGVTVFFFNVIHKRAALCLLQHFMKYPGKAVIVLYVGYARQKVTIFGK